MNTLDAPYRPQKGPTKRHPIPAGPILQIVEQWANERGGFSDPSRNAFNRDMTVRRVSPLQELAAKTGHKDLARLIYRLRNESSFIKLETADMLVCATYGPQLWRTVPELAAALEWLDEQSGPYCQECWAATSACECLGRAA